MIVISLDLAGYYYKTTNLKIESAISYRSITYKIEEEGRKREARRSLAKLVYICFY